MTWQASTLFVRTIKQLLLASSGRLHLTNYFHKTKVDHLTKAPSQVMELIFYSPLGTSHICPVNPSVHIQKNPGPMGGSTGEGTHVAPFKHGLRAHEVSGTIKSNHIMLSHISCQWFHQHDYRLTYNISIYIWPRVDDHKKPGTFLFMTTNKYSVDYMVELKLEPGRTTGLNMEWRSPYTSSAMGVTSTKAKWDTNYHQYVTLIISSDRSSTSSQVTHDSC